MDPSLRVVTRLPLDELWDDRGAVAAARETLLTAAEITGLLRGGPLCFVVAVCAEPLRWIALPSCFEFWKREAQPHVAQPGEAISLDAFPGGYCYVASRWRHDDPTAPPIVVLEKHH